MTRLTQSLAMGVGTAGAMADVSTYADLAAGVSRSGGRQSEFDDAAPGTFSFTLDNADGRFTPGNLSSALATTVTEGMQVCWKLDNGSENRLVAGTIQAIEPVFPSGESAWAQVRVTCDDMLGAAARHQLQAPLVDAIAAASVPIRMWPLTEAAGSTAALDLLGIVPLTPNLPAQVTFGTSAAGMPSSSAITATYAGSDVKLESATSNLIAMVPTAYAYGSETLGSYGVWVRRPVTGVTCTFILSVWVAGLSSAIGMTCSTAFTSLFAGTNVITPLAAISADVWHYIGFSTATAFVAGAWVTTVTYSIDGAVVGTQDHSQAGVTDLPDSLRGPSYLRLEVQAGSFSFARLSHTLLTLDEYTARTGTAQNRLEAIAATTPEITLDTVPTMSTAILGEQDGDSVLDAFNSVIRAEQGSIYSETSGTLLAPVEAVKTRARDRVADVDYSFDVETEASGATDFIRDITNMVSAITVDGPAVSVSYNDATLTGRVGSANTAETLPLQDAADLYCWATDRVWRGANDSLRAASITIDAFTTPTDRSADLLAMAPGDLIELTGAPLTQLGFETWTGWLLGVDESHTLTEHLFTLYLQPAWATPVYGTAKYAAGDTLTLQADITSGATSLGLVSTGVLFTTNGAHFPQNIRIGREVITLSAVSGASSPQTGTISARGVGAAPAAAHTAGDSVELDPTPLYAF